MVNSPMESVKEEPEGPLEQHSPPDDLTTATKENPPERNLQDPLRVEAILAHRVMVNDSHKRALEFPFCLMTATAEPRFEQFAPPTLVGFRAITFSEMKNKRDKVYWNRLLEAVIIEDPGTNMPSVYVLMEDKKGDLLRGSFYNVKGDPRLKYGAKISIVNPYLRFGAYDGKRGIRVDDPRSLIFHEEICSDRCRYCGKRNSKFKCARCARKYCSKECQIQDWKVLKHKLICFEKCSVISK